jgi:hypothetical protein
VFASLRASPRAWTQRLPPSLFTLSKRSCWLPDRTPRRGTRQVAPDLEKQAAAFVFTKPALDSAEADGHRGAGRAIAGPLSLLAP